MEMQEFFDMVKEALEARGLTGISVEQSNVIKNNGVMQMGVTLVRPGESISPNIYIEPFYRDFLKGRSIFDIADDIIRQSEAAKEQISFNIGDFTDFEKASKRIVFKLINREKNERLLEQIPFCPYMDLAMVFYYLLPEKDEDENKGGQGGFATILIHNTHLAMWKVTEEQIARVARENTPGLLPAAIVGMGELLSQMTHHVEIPGEVLESRGMYVLSNDIRMNGAAAMAYPDIVGRFADSLGKNIYIIPSSIHEVILVPETGEERGLNAMVCEVNRMQLDPKEVLADHVYYYDRKEGKMTGVLCEKTEYC